MPTYDGLLATGMILAEKESFRVVHVFRPDITRFHSGAVSAKLYPGERLKPIWYGCNAGAIDIGIFCWGESVGVCRMFVYDPYSCERVGYAENVGTGAWEKLVVSFIAQKKVYKVDVGNYDNSGYTPGDRKACWFDDLD